MANFFKNNFLKKSDVKKAYDIGDTLGTGNFAVVKKAVRKEDKKHFAIKIIDKSKVGDMEELQREVEIMRMIEHKHVIALEEIFDESKKLNLVMELVTGGELFDRIVAKGSYSEKEAAKLMWELCDSMKYLHKNGIVHRDLKPENLLYETPAEDAPIKIADFGLARVVNKHTMMNTACGTPGYVAPEILRNQGYDGGVDMWSLGVILYILLCGFPPFYEEDLPALFEQIMEGRYDFPSPWWDDISGGAKDLVRQLLTVDPKKRLTAEQALENPWVKGHSEMEYQAFGGDYGDKFRKYNANRKMKKAAHGVMAANRLSHMMGGNGLAPGADGIAPPPAED